MCNLKRRNNKRWWLWSQLYIFHVQVHVGTLCNPHARPSWNNREFWIKNELALKTSWTWLALCGATAPGESRWIQVTVGPSTPHFERAITSTSSLPVDARGGMATPGCGDSRCARICIWRSGIFSASGNIRRIFPSSWIFPLSLKFLCESAVARMLHYAGNVGTIFREIYNVIWRQKLLAVVQCEPVSGVAYLLPY